MTDLALSDQSYVEEARIRVHAPEDFVWMRAAGKLAAEVLDYITPFVVPGVTTGELDRLCHEFILDHKAIPAPLNYRGFPKATCISINHVVCHGIPGDRKLIDGDIANIDITVILDGWYGDTSRTYLIGDKVPLKARRLVDVTYDAMMLGIAAVKPGVHLGAIGYAIQSFAEGHRFSVVRDFCGHGIGKVFHAAPSVLHYGRPNEGPILREGMFFTIEPMINGGRYEVKVLADGWTAGDQGQVPVGAVRAHDRRHQGRLRDLYPVAGRPYQAALRGGLAADGRSRGRAGGQA